MIPKSLNLVQYFLCSHFQISLDFCDVWAKDFGATSIPYGVLCKPVDPCQQKIQLAQWARARMKPNHAKPVFLIQTYFAAESSGALNCFFCLLLPIGITMNCWRCTDKLLKNGENIIKKNDYIFQITWIWAEGLHSDKNDTLWFSAQIGCNPNLFFAKVKKVTIINEIISASFWIFKVTFYSINDI